MKYFVFIYQSSVGPDAEVDEAIKQQWTEWFGSMGDSLVDAGGPFGGDGRTVTKDGVQVAQNPATGYSLIKAADMDAAEAIAQQSPILNAPDGRVNIYEKFPM